jgi:hypothetical protein
MVCAETEEFLLVVKAVGETPKLTAGGGDANVKSTSVRMLVRFSCGFQGEYSTIGERHLMVSPKSGKISTNENTQMPKDFYRPSWPIEIPYL